MFLKRFFSTYSFGLDISDFSIKLASLKEKEGNLVLSSFGEKRIPKGVIEKAEIKDSKRLSILINQLLREARGEKIDTKYVVASLPEEKAFVRIIQLPKMKKEEVRGAIKWELEANIPLSISDVYYDWKIIPYNDPSNVYVLTVAMRKDIVERYFQTLLHAGLNPIALEVESVALVRALIKNYHSFHPIIILDMGISGTGLTIFSGETICFTSHIPVSGTDLNNAIAKSLNIDLEKAVDLKIKIGLDEKKDKKVASALRNVVDRLISQVSHYVSYYKSHGEKKYIPDGIISKILLCGGDSLLIGLPEYLSFKLKIPTELGNPWVNILKPQISYIPELPYKRSLAYTTALGLALYSFTSGSV